MQKKSINLISGDAVIAEKLIVNGGDVTLGDKNKNTPLHFAVINRKEKKLEIVECSLKKYDLLFRQRETRGIAPFTWRQYRFC